MNNQTNPNLERLERALRDAKHLYKDVFNLSYNDARAMNSPVFNLGVGYLLQKYEAAEATEEAKKQVLHD